MKAPCVYIVASQKNGTLYTGVTSDLERRIAEHRAGEIPGFTAKYKVSHWVWFEVYERMDDAIRREKQIKQWRRAWKLRLIETTNWHWHDLSADWRCDQIGLNERHPRVGGDPEEPRDISPNDRC